MTDSDTPTVATEVAKATPNHRRKVARVDPPPVEPTEEELSAAAATWSLPDLDSKKLRSALLHSSALPPHSLLSNERLEFLGDSIVNAAVAEYVYSEFPERSEGELAKGRALAVCKVALYEVGVRLGLPALIIVGSNTEGMLARGRRSLVADAMEALVATIYLQFGWERARQFVLSSLQPELELLKARQDLRDSKTILQERAQALKKPPPIYKIIAEVGDAHARTFTAEVTDWSGVAATGSGRSKRDAEQAAATKALEQIALS